MLLMDNLFTPKVLPFAGAHLDRCDNLRKDEAALHVLMNSARALFLPLWRGQVFILHDGTLALLQRHALNPLPVDDPGPIFLGTEGQSKQPWLAFSLKDDERAADEFALNGLGEWLDLRASAPLLNGPDLAIAGRAASLLSWHKRHRFCANCGAPTRVAAGGIKRQCDACGTEHFPRTDPVVIMLAVRGDQCLLGRQPGWPTRTYSALAGFVEQGESLEEACAREVGEEAGIAIGKVRYVLSQPWPFPSSLMVGLIAEALNDKIVLDDELEDARWFSQSEMREMLAGTHPDYDCPFAFSAANHLMQTWVGQ